LDSIVVVSRASRRLLSWWLSGLSALDVTFADGRQITPGVRDAARLEAELSVSRSLGLHKSTIQPFAQTFAFR